MENENRMMDEVSFKMWLSEFFTKKSNELEYSIRSQPKRMQKVTLDLSAAPANPIQINVPFKTVIVNRIYSTSAIANDKSGNVKIIFDQENLGNINNAVPLFANDTLESGTIVSKAFLTWSAQADTSIDLFFYPDIRVTAGTTKTQIVGTSTVSVIKEAVPSSIVTRSVSGVASATYTVPAGKYAKVNASCSAQGANGVSAVSVATVPILYVISGTSTFNSDSISGVKVPAGSVIDVQSYVTACAASAVIEIYDL